MVLVFGTGGASAVRCAFISSNLETNTIAGLLPTGDQINTAQL